MVHIGEKPQARLAVQVTWGASITPTPTSPGGFHFPLTNLSHLDPPQHPLALARGDGQVVDEVPVEVSDPRARLRLEIRDALDTHDLLAVITERRA